MPSSGSGSSPALGLLTGWLVGWLVEPEMDVRFCQMFFPNLCSWWSGGHVESHSIFKAKPELGFVMLYFLFSIIEFVGYTFARNFYS